MTDRDSRPGSDFPGEDTSPPRRRSESQALIRLQRESTDSISDIDGPDVEPLSPMTTMAKKRTRAWLPWVLILLALLVGLFFWIRHFSRASGTRTLPDAAQNDDSSDTTEKGE